MACSPMACSPGCKQGTVFSVGTFLLLGGVLAGIFWSDVTDYIYQSELSLSPSSIQFKMWKKTPIPMYLDFYFFNWTNAEAVRLGKEKPRFETLGPYVFSEVNTRVNVTWHPENDSVTYRQIREWHYVADDSNGTLDDEIVCPNTIAWTIAYMVKDYNSFIKRAMNVILSVEESFVVKKTVRELTFAGYDDPLLTAGIELEKVTNLSFSFPMDKFGWFYNRNGSDTYDGIYNMFTGQNNISNLGFLHTWNNVTETKYFKGSCGEVTGSTGEVIAPLGDDTALAVFSSDLCSHIMLTKSSDSVELYGIEGAKLYGAAKEFDNGTKYADYRCYTTNKSIVPSGVRDMSTCRYGAPAYISYSNFYLADPWYLESVEGLSANEEDDQFYIDMEPTTGIPLEVKARFQINLLLEPIKGMKMFEKIRTKVMIPVFYFCQRAKINEEFATEVKLLLNLAKIGMITFYGLAGIGGFIILIGVFITARGGWTKNEDTEMLIASKNSLDKSRSVNGEAVSN